jgi:hypothetical protein
MMLGSLLDGRRPNLGVRLGNKQFPKRTKLDDSARSWAGDLPIVFRRHVLERLAGKVLT